MVLQFLLFSVIIKKEDKKAIKFKNFLLIKGEK